MQTRGSERRVRRSAVVWGVLGFAVIGVVMLLAAKHQDAARLGGEIENRRARMQSRFVVDEAAADLASLANLRDDRQALARLTEEVEALRKSVAETRPLPARKPKPREGGAVDVTMEIVAADAWRNAGYGTPAAAVETVLWAAAGGDTDLLMKSFLLEGEAQKKATELLESLPPEIRQKYSRPDELVAFMTAKSVPLQGARIVVPKEQNPDRQNVTVQLRNAAGSVRQVHIEMRNTPAGWRAVVPDVVVAQYATELKGKDTDLR